MKTMNFTELTPKEMKEVKGGEGYYLLYYGGLWLSYLKEKLYAQ